eukprot:UN2978
MKRQRPSAGRSGTSIQGMQRAHLIRRGAVGGRLAGGCPEKPLTRCASSPNTRRSHSQDVPLLPTPELVVEGQASDDDEGNGRDGHAKHHPVLAGEPVQDLAVGLRQLV